MCYQLFELYTACKCMYYQHAVDKCAAYSRPGHKVVKRTIYVGYACDYHSSAGPDIAGDDLNGKSSASDHRQKRETLKKAIGKIRELEHKVPKDNKNKRLRMRGEVPGTTVGETPARPVAEPITEPDSERFIACQSSKTAKDEAITNDKLREHTDATKGGAKDQTIPKYGRVDTAISQLTENHIDGALSDTASIIETVFDDDTGGSYTSTLSSVTTPDLVDSITSGLLYDTHLQYLWPQFFLRTVSAQVAFEQIARLLLRYALDLQASATDPESPKSNHRVRVEAARFLERQRYNLAREICAMFPTRESHGAASPATNVMVLQTVAPEIATSHDIGLDSGADSMILQGNSFVTLKQFLFATEPFYCFRENLRASVEQPLALPFRIKVLDSARRAFSNISNTLNRIKVPTGMKRLHCVCNCGQKFFDDYKELRPGALEDLKILLNQHGVDTSTDAGDLESNLPRKPAPSATINNRAATTMASSAAINDLRLPRYWHQRDSLDIGKCKKDAATRYQPRESHIYLLACLPLGRWASKLYQADLCTIDSDQDFFSLLRVLYRNSRSAPLLSRLRRVKAIHFVQFEMYRTEVADIHAHPAIPPDIHKDDYIYEPMPMNLMPPIGPNVLVHFFEHPTHAGLLPDLYRRIPKKRREKLEACPVKGSSTGWGLAFVEEIDTFLFFLCGLLGFLCCFIVAIVWTVIRDDDVQGGFGIGSFLLGFLVFVGGLVQTSLSTRGGM